MSVSSVVLLLLQLVSNCIVCNMQCAFYFKQSLGYLVIL